MVQGVRVAERYREEDVMQRRPYTLNLKADVVRRFREHCSTCTGTACPEGQRYLFQEILKKV